MAIWTIEDRDAIKSAMLIAASEGIASVTVGGQTVQARTLDELRRMLDMVQADLAQASTGFGMRMIKTIPPGAG